MRLTLWIVPTCLFLAVAVAIVRQEAEDHSYAAAPTPHAAPTAAPAVDLGVAGAPLQAITVDDWDDERPITSPPGGGPQPVWRVVDFGLSRGVLSDSDIPTLAISHRVPVAESEGVPVILASAEKTRANSPWEVIGHSVQGKPIHVRKFGTAGEVTLLIAGLDGEDRIAVKWIDTLSQRLGEAPEMIANRQIILLRDANPDGLTRKQTANDHGVELNRNFPTPAYRPGATSGAGPASEPETRAILEVLYRDKPSRVIHVQSAGRSEVAANSAAEQLAVTLQQGRQLRQQAWDQAQVAGSLEEFATTILAAEVLSMKLATGDDWRSAAIGHFPTLMAAAVPQIAAESLNVAQTSRSSKPNGDETETDLVPSPFRAEGEITRLERKGYEELPPPPEKPSW